MHDEEQDTIKSSFLDERTPSFGAASQTRLVDSPGQTPRRALSNMSQRSRFSVTNSSDSLEKLPEETDRGDDKLVEFEENDSINPKNWSYSRKWVATTLVSLISFITAASSSIVAPGLPQIATELNITNSVEKSLVFAIFGMGFIVGAVPYGPLSELYGRAPVLHISYFVFFVFNLASGFATTKTQLLVFRFLAGVGGSAPNTLGAGVVSDCFNAEEIGRGSAFYGLAPRLGPAVGPLVGGFIVQNLDWRWSFHITSMFAGALGIFALIFVQETRPQIILERKAKKLREETGCQEYRTKDWPRPRGDLRHFGEGMKRPIVYLCTHHIVQYLALYQFFIAGTLYLVLSTFHGLWIFVYRQNIEISGLNYISIGLGLVLGNQLCARVSDNVYNYLRHRLKSSDPDDPDAGRPEYRVPLMLVGAVIYPIGFLIYGWSAQKQLFWLVPNIGIFLVSVGIIIISQGIKLYTVSTYGTYAASAQGAVNFTRSIGSGTFPLFAPFILAKLGYGWMGTVMACVAVVLGIPGPIILWYHGPRLRKKAQGLQKADGRT
ncbi:hypothetical protein MBM_07770 [Drepanopeziza brunnea f. sp. 'multigermtubi' MB_m1]|uniref:Major facilitator superfamily (MFS) profile domain-containing protein n=1 Tax=Marssonina brunnea f. sp. multigermtubi (strain MB_m1) TaxID=1072389 RepID=K1WZN9_MARBU|nr:uncharacterized protein MBM_07770 [Drepanopeziza brunnea f. sp. 'multigermtubi' MB_m1]EKD14093.1 hypothetical protein MBM_07770 [Drepanopeziza brunnea f. sp. 'multigermtubi' MB_m1]